MIMEVPIIVSPTMEEESSKASDPSKYYFISNQGGIDSDSLDGEQDSMKSEGCDVEDIEAFLNEKYYAIVINDIKSQILREIKDTVNVRLSVSDRLFDNLTKEVDFLRNDSKSKNRIMELIIRNFANARRRSSVSYRRRPPGMGQRNINVEEAFQYPMKPTLRSNNNSSKSNDSPDNDDDNKDICEETLSERSEDMSSDTGCSSEVDEEIENTLVSSALDESEMERMRVALGNSAKRFMDSMSTVDDMKNYIVNMAVDIKLNEIDVTIPPPPPANLANGAITHHYEHNKVSEF